MSDIEREFWEGYSDGRNPIAPYPGDNRSEAYRHSFEVGRAELAGKPIPAQVSRDRAAAIEARWNA